MKKMRTALLGLSLLLLSTSASADYPWAEFQTYGKEHHGSGTQLVAMVQAGSWTYALASNGLFRSSNLKDFVYVGGRPPRLPPPGNFSNRLEEQTRFRSAGANLYLSTRYTKFKENIAGAPFTKNELLKAENLVSVDEGKTWASIALESKESIQSIVHGKTDANQNSDTRYWMSTVRATGAPGRLLSSTDGVNFTPVSFQALVPSELFIVDGRLIVVGSSVSVLYRSELKTIIAQLPNAPSYMEFYMVRNTGGEGRALTTRHVQHPENPRKIVGTGYAIILGDVKVLTSSQNKVTTYKVKMDEIEANSINGIHCGEYYLSHSRRIRLAEASDMSRSLGFDAAVVTHVTTTNVATHTNPQHYLYRNGISYTFNIRGVPRKCTGNTSVPVDTSAWRLITTPPKPITLPAPKVHRGVTLPKK